MDDVNSGLDLALATGGYEPALALMLDTLVSLRSPAVAATADAACGAMLEAEPVAAMSPGALDAVMARIAALPRDAAHRGRAAALDASIRKLPDGLRLRAESAARERGWKPAGLGIRTLDLGLPGSVKAELIHIGAGVAVPRHTHAGREYTLCLEGGFSDAGGRYGPGDVSVADGNVEHTPVADRDGACLVLAVTDDKLEFKGLFGFAQRVLGGS